MGQKQQRQGGGRLLLWPCAKADHAHVGRHIPSTNPPNTFFPSFPSAAGMESFRQKKDEWLGRQCRHTSAQGPCCRFTPPPFPFHTANVICLSPPYSPVASPFTHSPLILSTKRGRAKLTDSPQPSAHPSMPTPHSYTHSHTHSLTLTHVLRGQWQQKQLLLHHHPPFFLLSFFLSFFFLFLLMLVVVVVVMHQCRGLSF